MAEVSVLVKLLYSAAQSAIPSASLNDLAGEETTYLILARHNLSNMLANYWRAKDCSRAKRATFVLVVR
jgi:hypothetical protein